MPCEYPKGFEMQSVNNKISKQRSANSTSYYTSNWPSWWNSSVSLSPIPQPCYSLSLNVNKCSRAELNNQMKQPSHQLPDHDSSPTQSTDQSHQGVSDDDTHKKQFEGKMKSVLLLGIPETVFPPPKIPIPCIQYPFANPCFGGVLAARGSHAIIRPDMVGMAPSVRPLPFELAGNGLIYVNAKQYNAIVRRRKQRAKFEAENKLVKVRKPYLHESRHLHAVKRMRGSSGRFLNTKDLQKQSMPSTTIHYHQNFLGSALLQLVGDGEVPQSL